MLDEPDDLSVTPQSPDEAEIESVRLERVAQYEIEGLVARGGESVVYRATDSTLHRTVALKVMDDSAKADRLIREARNTSKLLHPGIASVYQAGVDEASGCAFVAFEWVEGSTLRNHLRGGPAPLADLLRYSEQIADAVAFAHEQGWVHGDLKADNVVLTVGEGQVKLIDFGLSTTVEAVGDDEIWGTPAYMAPELFEGAPRSVASDLYALGVLLYEIATGSLPFGGSDGDETKVRRAQKEAASDVRDWEPNVPAPFAQMIQSLLSPDPDRRGPTATEVARWARHARRPAGRRAPWLVPLTVAALLGIGGYATRGLWLPTSPRTSGEKRTAAVETGGVERVPEIVVIGEWEGPASELDSVALLRDVLVMSVHGDDPGSALIDLPSVREDVRQTTLRGRLDRRDGLYVAEWEAESGQESVIANGLVELARAVVDRVWERSPSNRVLVNARASTLCDSLAALQSFASGVRASEQGEWSDALGHFERARQEAGTFPEATAWEAAIRLSRGEFDRAAATATLLRDRDSHLCRVLGNTLSTPTRDRTSRWGRGHRLARRVDLTLDLHDPRSADRALIERLERGETGDASHYTRGLLRLSVRYGRPEPARAAFDRFAAYGNAEDEWLVTFYRWRLDAAENEALPPARWMLRLRPPTDFLTIPYFLQDGDLDAALHRAGEELGPAEARASAAMVFAVGGRFDEALDLAGSLSRPLDRGWGERLRAAVHVLAGDSDGAVVALNNARDHDPKHPKTLFLLEYVKGDPFAVEPLGASEVSEFTRWHNAFSALGSVRNESDPAVALEILAGVRWVDAELHVTDWPELSYLGWIERIRLTASSDREAALREMARFRRWWPRDLAPKSRVSGESRRLEVEIEGAQ